MPEKEKPVKRGFPALPCLKCGAAGCVQVYLEDMGFRCSECEAEWTAAEILVTLAAWAKVAEWLETAPVRE